MNFKHLLRNKDTTDLKWKWLGPLIQVLNEGAQPSLVQNGQFKPVHFMRKVWSRVYPWDHVKIKKIKDNNRCQMVKLALFPLIESLTVLFHMYIIYSCVCSRISTLVEGAVSCQLQPCIQSNSCTDGLWWISCRWQGAHKRASNTIHKISRHFSYLPQWF